jgi:predicted MFS family arabinose efflux permease
MWSGAFLSSLGTWTQDVALSWLIHTRYLDPRYLGYRSFAAEAPLIAFMLVGGARADRADRRRILLLSQVLQMAFAAALWLLFATGRLGVLHILALAFLAGLAQSQSAPTYQAVLTSLVAPREIQSAVALNSLQFNLSRAIGPVVAALLLARAGTGSCFAVNTVSFLAVILAIARIELPPRQGGAPESLRESLVGGLRHVRHSPALSRVTLVAGTTSVLAFPLVTYLPVLAGEALRSGASGYSQLLASFGLGAIGGALATAHRGRAAGRGRLLARLLAGYGAATTAAVLLPWQRAAMALLALSGFTLVSAFSILNALVQEHAADALRGRVVSIYGLAFRGGMPLGSLAAGFLVRAFGAPAALAAFSTALLLLGLLLAAKPLTLAEAAA